MLWLGLLARDTGIPASVRLGIQDEATALDFDLAVTLRLLRFDNEREKAKQEFWVQFIGGATGGMIGGG